MDSPKLQHHNNLKVKVKKKLGRIEKLITNSIPIHLGISRTRVKNLICRGLVFSSILNRPIDLNYKLSEDETFILELNLNKKTILEKEKMKLDIIYEDEHLLVINKEAGLVVHPGSGTDGGTLVNGFFFH